MDSYSNLPDVAPGDIIESTHENQQSAAINRLEAVLTLNPPKAPVRVATTGALSASFVSDVLTASANGLLTVDGVEPSVGQRVLVKNETGAHEIRNGIYVVTDAGSASTQWGLTRSDDMRLSNQAPGALVFVSEGAVNAGTQWASNADASFVLNTSGLEFSLLTNLVPKAPIYSPAFTGIPTAPTASPGDNSAQIATTAYVDAGLATRAPSSGIPESSVTNLVSDLAARAPLASPALTGTPTAPTASQGTHSTQIATTAYVDTGLATRAPSSGILQSSVTNLVADLAAKVSSSTTINGHSLSSDVSLTKNDIGLGNVDNTSDASKPVSTATQAALDGKQPLDSDLTAIAALSTTGFVVRTGAGTATARALVAADIPDLSSVYQPLERGWCAPQGRLTTSSTDPVGDGSTSGSTTLYYLPYNGGRIALYDGAGYWSQYNIPSPCSLSLTGLAAGIYDIFAYLSGGSVALTTRAWSSSSSRGYNLVWQANGGRVNPSTTSQLWLGSMYITGLGGGTCDYPYQNASNFLNGRRFLFNAYNRVMRFSVGGYATTFSLAASSSWTQIVGSYAMTVVGESTNVATGMSVYSWQFSTGTTGVQLALSYSLGSFSLGVGAPLPATTTWLASSGTGGTIGGGANISPGFLYFTGAFNNSAGGSGSHTVAQPYFWIGVMM